MTDKNVLFRTETRVRELKAEFLKGKGSPDLVSNILRNPLFNYAILSHSFKAL